MNKVADFSDTLADRWDELCYHDPEKLNDILRRTGLRKGLRIFGHRMRDRRIGKLSPALFPLTNRGSGYLSGDDRKGTKQIRDTYRRLPLPGRTGHTRKIFRLYHRLQCFPPFPGTRETDLPFSRTTAGWRQTGGLPQRKPRQDQRTP